MPKKNLQIDGDFSEDPYGIAGKNRGSFMIEHVGNFDKGRDRLKGKQLQASLQIYHYLVHYCGASILFHRQHAAKSCPGSGIDRAWFVASLETGSAVALADQEYLISDKPPRLAVDGIWGKAVTLALQRVLGTIQDRVISGQYQTAVTRMIYSTEYGPPYTGSLVVKALQEVIGADRDGLIGPQTVTCLQIWLGTPVDGKISRPSPMVQAMQTQLNAGTFTRRS